MNFNRQYGPWALVAGASEGLGAAFAESLASRGLNLFLIARRREPLEALSQRLRDQHGVEVRCAPMDLASVEVTAQLGALVQSREVGLVIYNAAYAPIGELLGHTEASLQKVIDVNIRGPVLLSRAFLPDMASRGRGGLVLMSSLAGLQGSPNIAAYSASKAFNNQFGEALWHEMAPHGVNVVVGCAGAIRTPNYLSSAQTEAPGSLDPEQVVAEVLDGLGKGPTVIPGWLNRVASLLMARLFPRRLAIRIMANQTRSLT